jgi:hypothetical protein
VSEGGTLAVDFGTANSYFCKCPPDRVSPEGVDFGTGRDGLATAVLYRPGREPLIGDVAIEEYAELNDQERSASTLRTHFKPDIACSDSARADAVAFLSAVVGQARRDHVHLGEADREVLFGVPSEAGEEFRAALSAVAGEAGFGAVRTVEEPKGALLHHVWQRDISPSEAQDGILVVDFGGGTCDFAVLFRSEPKYSWGDMLLGGRLFDDVFFQWLCEQHPDAAPAMRSRGDELFVLAHQCRETKEFFSRTMARDRGERVSRRIADYGAIRDMTWEEFCQRARQYRPSEAFARQWGGDGPLGELCRTSEPMDLLAWFSRSLAEGLARQPIQPADIRRVILAGGSSLWPFVAETVIEQLHLDDDRLQRSDRPYAVVARGLAMLPAMKRRFQATRDQLRRDLPAFLGRSIRPLVGDQADRAAEGVADEVVRVLFDQRVRAVLEAFREDGGTVAELKRSVAAEASAAELDIRRVIRERGEMLAAGLPRLAMDRLAAWLAEYEVKLPATSLAVEADTSASLEAVNDLAVPEVYGDIRRLVTGVMGIVVGLVTANLCGGAGVALLASGPIGWVVGLAAGVAGVGLVAYMGRSQARQAVENLHTPRWLARRTLTQAKIDRARADLREQLRKQVRRQLQPVEPQLVDRLEDLVRREVRALSEISQL